ncbi:MAG: hypothetical protein AAB482_01595 [Patescibacteria group bacterium]
MKYIVWRKYFVLFVFFVGLGASVSVAFANHSWGGYHWARTANPFILKLGYNTSSAWKSSLAGASADWSQSSVLDLAIVPSQTNPKNCKPINGRVEVCDSKYGNNGWLGLASIWANGKHITQGTIKLNDTYFNTPTYNTSAWRNLVMCQEIAHTVGLDHQDEDFYNAPLGTCMDYTIDPTPNQHPNQHDYDELEIIYAHLDSISTLSQTVTAKAGQDIDHENRATWGKEIHTSLDKRTSVFERDFGNNEKAFTFVFWTGEKTD